MKKPLVINLFGGPGAGKSTGAAYIFARLKQEGVRAELVTEVAKDEVWERNSTTLDNQEYIFGSQSLRQSRLKDKAEVIVTDAPLLNTLVYGNSPHQQKINDLAKAVFTEYENINYLVWREKPYVPFGRTATEIESDELALKITGMLIKEKVPFRTILGNMDGYDEIVKDIFAIIRKEESNAREERQSET